MSNKHTGGSTTRKLKLLYMDWTQYPHKTPVYVVHSRLLERHIRNLAKSLFQDETFCNSLLVMTNEDIKVRHKLAGLQFIRAVDPGAVIPRFPRKEANHE